MNPVENDDFTYGITDNHANNNSILPNIVANFDYLSRQQNEFIETVRRNLNEHHALIQRSIWQISQTLHNADMSGRSEEDTRRVLSQNHEVLHPRCECKNEAYPHSIDNLRIFVENTNRLLLEKQNEIALKCAEYTNRLLDRQNAAWLERFEAIQNNVERLYKNVKEIEENHQESSQQLEEIVAMVEDLSKIV